MPVPDTKTCLRCLARSWFVGALMSARGMQHLGHLYALDPGLAVLWPDPAELAAARARKLGYMHTHPHWVPLFTGITLSLEGEVAAGRITPEFAVEIRNTMASTLSALGDSLFSGSILVTWALTTTFLLLEDRLPVAFAWTLLLFIALMAFRVCSFFLGVRHGLGALDWVKRLNCINWSERLKFANAVLLALVLWRMWPHSAGFEPLVAALCLCIGALLTAGLHLPRPALLAAAFLALNLVGELAFIVSISRVLP